MVRPGKALFVSLLLALLAWATAAAGSVTRLAAVGDFGADATGWDGVQRETAAAALVRALDAAGGLAGVLALGDCNYPLGAAATVDQNVGKHYGQFMWPLRSNYSQGAPDRHNRFFPCPGNHDWYGPGQLDVYLSYMPVSGRRYYDVVVGSVHIFSLDSDPREDAFDGTFATSRQAQWLRTALANSSAPWKVVMCHHPPYSSGPHGPSPWMQWPFEAWGAHAVLSGHDHSYERLHAPNANGGFPFFVNGLGGASWYGFDHPLNNSVFKFSGQVGAQLIEATSQRLRFSFLPASAVTALSNFSDGSSSIANMTIDCYELNKDSNGWVAYGQCSTDAVTDDSSASATNSHSQSPHLSGSPSPRVSTAAGPNDGHGPACVVRGGDCSSGACCQPLTCHLEGKRCGAWRPEDFQWMRRRRHRQQ